MRATLAISFILVSMPIGTAMAQTASQRALHATIAQANELVWAGELKRAQQMYEKAIADSHWDKGRTYATQIHYDQGITPERKAYGEEQLKRILKDRPHMNAHGIADSEIARWCSYRLAGIEIGLPVRWNPVKPAGSYFADHGRVDDRIEIRIADKDSYTGQKERLFEASWAALVFELINASHWDDFDNFNWLAQGNEISRNGYIKGMFSVEMDAVAKCRAFYVRVFLPWADKAGILTHPAVWYTDVNFWGRSHDVLASYPDRNGYPWQVYGAYYDLVMKKLEDRQNLVDAAPAPLNVANEIQAVASATPRITNVGGTMVIEGDRITIRDGKTVIKGGDRKIYVEGGELKIEGGANSVFDLRLEAIE